MTSRSRGYVTWKKSPTLLRKEIRICILPYIAMFWLMIKEKKVHEPNKRLKIFICFCCL